jgi:hypothetical protein
MGVIPQPIPTGYTEGNCVEYTPVSEIFTFNLGCIPSRSSNQHLQLMFQNRYGHYDYFTFMAGRYQGIGIERQTYNQWNIDWGSSDPNKTQYSRGVTDSQVQMNETVVVHTGFINQPDFEFLEELFTSSQVYEIQPNGGVRPVNIISTEFEKKIQGNKTIFDIQLTYIYSNNIELLGK